jgi:hypothetical protein
MAANDQNVIPDDTPVLTTDVAPPRKNPPHPSDFEIFKKQSQNPPYVPPGLP